MTLCISATDLAWLAGLLEGEGSFRISKYRYKNGERAYPAVDVGMVDEDIIKRAADITGFGRVYYSEDPVRRNKRYQPRWIWTVQRTAEATAIMRAVLPYMGVRRSEQIESVLSAISLRWPPPEPTIQII